MIIYAHCLSITDRSDIGEIPYSITLGTQDIDVELEQWGSGTQNRTGILMTLFKAKRVRNSAASAQKVTPVIVTTHSPYLLSLANPKANVLLERACIRRKVRQTVVVDTAGDRWMEPFALALGVGSAEVAPWKDALFTSKDSVLLVEGDFDKEYLVVPE